MIVDQAVYVKGARRAEPCGDLSDEVAALRASGDPTAFVWIGLKDPTREEFLHVNDEFDLHSLAIEDALAPDQRAKIERYPSATFAVLKTVRYIEETSDIETGDVKVFVGDHYVVTVRQGEANPLDGVRRRLEADSEHLNRGALSALHVIVDSVVDNYVAVDEEIQKDLDEIEERVFAMKRVESTEIYKLKREVLEFKRAVLPLARPIGALHAPTSPLKDAEMRLYFRDVADHLLEVIDHTESHDRLLTDILNVHLAQVGVRQNDDMRKISSWVAIAALPTMIAGIYGMNFTYMPELTASVAVGGHEFYYGYFVIVAVIVAGCAGLYREFKRTGWL
ncbi:MULTISPECIES: magnesium and cobalt transport protein CorA [unclassified Janibacter]|uniref:magnesium and cobalt transport protein CorA n=1 Tax=unclassified Janibacter TaxID=2649294 RepID=UPI003CFE6C62